MKKKKAGLAHAKKFKSGKSLKGVKTLRKLGDPNPIPIPYPN